MFLIPRRKASSRFSQFRRGDTPALSKSMMSILIRKCVFHTAKSINKHLSNKYLLRYTDISRLVELAVRIWCTYKNVLIVTFTLPWVLVARWLERLTWVRMLQVKSIPVWGARRRQKACEGYKIANANKLIYDINELSLRHYNFLYLNYGCNVLI